MDRQPKRILFYSVGHTGTHFLNDLIETCTTQDKIVHTESYILKNIGVNEREKLPVEKFIKTSYSLIPKDKLKDTELITIWSHIYEPGSTLLKSIINNKPSIPVVSPMRDPLLRLNTNMFWNNKYNVNTESRLKYIRNTVKMFIELLSIPDEHRFLFPVDVENLKDGRERHYKEIFEFCGLTPTQMTEDFYKKWKPAHETKTHPQNPKSSKKRQIFEDNKVAILNKDIDTLMKTMNPEITYLRQQEDLKNKLEQYGYKNLVWW